MFTDAHSSLQMGRCNAQRSGIVSHVRNRPDDIQELPQRTLPLGGGLGSAGDQAHLRYCLPEMVCRFGGKH